MNNKLVKLLFFLAIAALAANFCIIIHTIITQPKQMDYRPYYFAAKVFAEGGDPYDFGQLKQASDSLVTMPYVYPPITLYILKPLLLFDFSASYYVFFAFKLMVFICLIIFWCRYFETDIRYQIVLFLFCIFAYYQAAQRDLYSGNIVTFEQALIWLAILFFIKRKPVQFTILIMIASLFKFTAAILILLLFLDNDKKSRLNFLGGITGYTVMQILPILFHPQLAAGWLASVRSLKGLGFVERGRINQASLTFIQESLDNLSTGLGINIASIDLIVYALFILALSYMAYRVIQKYDFRNDRIGFVMGSLFFYALILPRFKDYSYMLLIVPSMYVIKHAIKNIAYRIIAIAGVCVSYFAYQQLIAAFILFVIFVTSLMYRRPAVKAD